MLHASLALANPVLSPPFFSPLATILAVLFPPLPAGILFFSNASGRVRFHRNTQKRWTTLLCAYAITPHACGAYTPCLWTGLLCISYNECLPVTDLSHATVSHTHTQTLTILLTYLVSLQSGHSTDIKCIVSSRDTIMAILNVRLYQFPPLLSATCRKIGLGNNGRG